ncbi:MAG: hypothetical protein DMD89_28640 [Candidatus Rokuibacteriota bacterium]|nr:MAG: hypothetical protein DMD89_28640 [Candidatus Rokubacteria bacterium]
MAHVVALVLTLAVVAPAAADMKILEPHDPTNHGNIIAHKVSWVPAPAPAARYQVRVYSFDRIEGPPGRRFP